MNATSIDVTSSNSIAFGYVNELARPGRLIAGRHRLQSPLSDPSANAASRSIWCAESSWLGTPVLVELLDPAIAEDTGLLEAFEWEARAAAAVTSPFVNRILDFGVDGGTPYLVTQLPYGDTLAARIDAERRPSLPELERIFRDLACAVDDMHALDLLHRDLRSDRIFLYRAPSARRAARDVASVSFAISKLMNDTLDLVRTMARRAVTPADIPHYSSPEQVLGTQPVGARSDLWSLAAIAFECVTGTKPFGAATIGDTLVQICTQEPRRASELAEVPPGLDAWFERGLRKAPDERWSSALEMADALSSVLSP